MECAQERERLVGKVWMWQSPSGQTMTVCVDCTRNLSKRWPQDDTGQEFCEIIEGWHVGSCDLCGEKERAMGRERKGREAVAKAVRAGGLAVGLHQVTRYGLPEYDAWTIAGHGWQITVSAKHLLIVERTNGRTKQLDLGRALPVGERMDLGLLTAGIRTGVERGWFGKGGEQ